jgi:hypothetical protein
VTGVIALDYTLVVTRVVTHIRWMVSRLISCIPVTYLRPPAAVTNRCGDTPLPLQFGALARASREDFETA